MREGRQTAKGCMSVVGDEIMPNSSIMGSNRPLPQRNMESALGW